MTPLMTAARLLRAVLWLGLGLVAVASAHAQQPPAAVPAAAGAMSFTAVASYE